jgi:O-antigen/teichoic acid export membrane protein
MIRTGIDSVKHYVTKWYTDLPDSPGLRRQGFQSLILFSSLIGAMGLSFIGSILTSRILGPAHFGDLKFIQTLWLLLSLLCTFGLFQAGSRVLLLETDESSAKQIIGVILLIALIMGVAIGLITVIIAHPIDLLFHTQLSFTILMLAPLIIGLPLRDALCLIFQSTNQISLLSGITFFPPLFFLVGVFVVSRFMVLSAGMILGIQQVTLLGVILVVIIIIRPRFGSFRNLSQKFKAENKRFGLSIYTGSLAAVATSYINSLAISYWVDNTSIGFFSLASTLTEPLKLIPNAAATSSYKSFLSQKKVPKLLLMVTFIASFCSFFAAWWFFGKPLLWFYSADFSTVGSMARIMALGSIAFGFGDLFNRFLGAHGLGEKIRNVAYKYGLVNVMGFLFLTPLIGVNGAVITSVLSSFTYLIFMFLSYKRFTSTL